MESYIEEPVKRSLRGLSGSYAAMMFIMPLNYIFGSYLFYYIASILMQLATGSATIDHTTESGYAITMLLNELISYTIPLIASVLLFKRYIPAKSKGIPEFYDAEGYRRFPFDIVLLYAAGIFFASSGSILTSIFSEIMNEAVGTPEPEAAFSSTMPWNTFTFIAFELCSVIIAPICEEVLYRHFMLKPLRKYGDWLAVTVSAIMFSISHYNFDQMLYTLFLGIFLGIIVVRSDSILPAVICHMVNNAVVGITSYRPDSFGNDDVDAFFASAGDFLSTALTVVYYAGVAAAVIALILGVFRLRSPSGASEGKQFGAFFGSPLVIIGLVVSVGFTVLLLYLQ